MKLLPAVLSFLVLDQGTAFAQQAALSIAVSYADLNLASIAGVKALDSRLANAVRSVCQAYDGTAIPERRLAEQRCVREKGAEAARLRDAAIASQAVPRALASR